MSKTIHSKGPDSLSWAILEELQKDARLPNAEIGRRVGLSAPAVAERIFKMEEQGIIRGYHAALDMDKLDLTIRAFIFYRTTALLHAELIQMLESVPGITEWHTITGNYTLLLKIVVSSSERLAAIIQELEKYGETNTSLILQNNPVTAVFSQPA